MSPRNNDTSISDMESHSEMSELSIVTKPSMEVDSSAPLSPLTPISDSQKSVDSGIKVTDSQPPSVSSDRENNNNVIGVGGEEKDMDRLWERVEGRGESPDIENHWKTIEGKKSQLQSNDSDATTIRPSIDDTLTTSVLESEVEVFHEVSVIVFIGFG